MNTPIGIIDSGSGGLTIWKEIISLLPHEPTMYIGDHLHMPYSKKTTLFIQDRVISLIEFLFSKKAKLVVIACNTATVAGIDIYRKKFPNIPIIGVVPVIKTAILQSKIRHIAVLSTEYTTKSSYQENLIKQFAAGCMVERIGSTDLVSLIEKGDATSSEITRELSDLLLPAISEGIDVLVLGCTHYPFVRNQIRAIVGNAITVLDSGGAVARQTKRVLEREHLMSKAGKPEYTFYTTGNATNISSVTSRLLGQIIIFRHANI